MRECSPQFYTTSIRKYIHTSVEFLIETLYKTSNSVSVVKTALNLTQIGLHIFQGNANLILSFFYIFHF